MVTDGEHNCNMEVLCIFTCKLSILNAVGLSASKNLAMRRNFEVMGDEFKESTMHVKV